jgi:hypothetical protein
MAGIRHHILPRFLLKGFASKVVADQVFTWVYRKNGKVFESNIINVAVERYFYGKGGELNVDDEITEIENTFAPFLTSLRREEDGYYIVDPKMSEFVGHLTSRTKHLRDSFIESTGFLLDTLFAYLADKKNFNDFLLEYYKRHPEVIRQALDNALAQMSLDRYQRHRLKNFMLSLLTPEIIAAQIEQESSEYSFMFKTLGPMLLEKLPQLVAEGQIKTLAKSRIAEPRVDTYRQLRWHVRKSENSLILGDVGCLFEVRGAKSFKSLTDKHDQIITAYLPISLDTMVVGTNSTEISQIDFGEINKTFAKGSREFFVCSESSEDVRILLQSIGGEAEIISREELRQLVNEIIWEA